VTDSPRFCIACNTYGDHHTDGHEEAVRHDYENARADYLRPYGPDWGLEDQRWAYEAMLRAQHKLRAFDVT
jgi:hypothetical protein